MSRVGVVVTCYNYGRYLPFAVESVLAQTHQDLEAVIVNDGSTDDTEAQARRFLADSRVRYLSQPNGGQARAKNAGIRALNSEFIAFLDADDVWEKTKLERQMRLFEDPRTGVVYSRMRFMGPDGRIVAKQPKGLPMYRGNVLKRLLSENFVPFSSSVVRRKALESAGGFDEALSMAIDWDLWLKVAVNWRFDYVPDPLLDYREGHAGQMSKNLAVRLECCDKIFERFVRSLPPGLSEKDVRDAKVYTLNSRAYPLRSTDPSLALSYYQKSFRLEPFQWAAFKGLLLSAADCLAASVKRGHSALRQ